MIKLPKENTQQEAGHFGVFAFNATHPLGWRVTETDGDSDAGLDLQVQVVSDGQYKSMFNVQVKACKQSDGEGKNKRLNKEGTHYSQELKISTLNYYAQIENPVMLAFADLCQEPDPRQCKTYYLWIDDELDKLLEGRGDLSHLDKETHTFHVPIENEINASLDVIPYLLERIEKKRSLEGLFQKIKTHVDNPVDVVSQVQKKLTSKVEIDTILNETDFPWLEPPEDSIAAELKTAYEFVKSNNISQAHEHFEKIEAHVFEKGSDHEKAEFCYQKGATSLTAGLKNDAIELLSDAYKLCPQKPRYRIAYIELDLYENYFDEEKCSEHLAEIECEEDIQFVHLRLKLMSALKKFPEAHELMSKQDEKDLAVLKPLVLFLEKNYSGCVEACEYSVAKLEISDRQRLSISIIKSRALFQLGAGDHFHKEANEIIPYSGLPGMDVALLKDAWKELCSAWGIAEKLNYPSNIDFIIDISSILSLYFDDSEIFYSRLKAIAKSRPANIFFQESLLSVAQQLDDHDVILKQLETLPADTKNKIQLALLKNVQNKKKDLLKIVIDNKEELIKEQLPYTDIILVLAIEAAHILVDIEERDSLLKEVEKFENASALSAVIDFLISINDNLLTKEEALKQLYKVFEGGCHDIHILILLFDYLDPEREEHAKKLIQVSLKMSEIRGFFEREYLKISRAKATLNDWTGMHDCTIEAMERFGEKPKLQALNALALDELGQTGSAIEILEQVIQNDKYDSYPMELYAHISARCGLTSKSKGLFESLLGRAGDNSKKAEIYRILFVLEMSSNPNSEKLLEYCMKYGQFNNTDSETEEGIFLMLFFGATNNEEVKPTDQQVEIFQKRMAEYAEKFPESKVCRQVTFSSSPTGEEMLEKLREVTGMTDEKLQYYKKNENLLKYGQLPIPYLIRPSHLLNVPDILYQWQLTKYAHKDLKQYQLVVASSDYKYLKNSVLQQQVVLVDEITLILLHDTDLLDHLFSSFKNVAIAKNTLKRFQYWSQHVFMSPLADKARAIIDGLSHYIDRIIQPTCHNEATFSVELADLKEYGQIVRENGYVYYSDDVLSRFFVCEEDYINRSMCTLHLIDLLGECGSISAEDGARKVAKMCSWNIGGIRVKFLDILRIAAADNISGRTIVDVHAAICQSQDVSCIVGYLWTIDKSVDDSLRDLGNFVSLMIAGEGGLSVEDIYIGAFWYSWYEKVQFHRDAGSRMSLLSNSFTVVAINLQKKSNSNVVNKSNARRLLGIYEELVSSIYGDKMDETVYRQSIVNVAKTIAALPEDSRGNAFLFVSEGFTDGTQFSELLKTSYTEERILLDKKKENEK